MVDLEPAAQNLVELVGADLDVDVQITIANIVRVLDGVQRYAHIA